MPIKKYKQNIKNVINKIKINETLFAGMIILVVISGAILFSINKAQNKIPQTPPLFNENGDFVGESLINSNREGGCFTADEVPKNNDYISYEYDGKCYINSLFSEKTLAIQGVLDENYDSLYNSRTYFDNEIKKLHDESKDMKFIWHPDYKTNSYKIVEPNPENGKGSVDLDIGKFKLKIDYLRDNSLNDVDLYTHIEITQDSNLINKKDYKEVGFSHIYKIKVGNIEYYLLGLCSGGMHGCGLMVPIIYDGINIKLGNDIEGVDFSDWLRVENFFTKNGDLYAVFDDSRYFFSYSGSNNASYNSAVPKIYKFDKTTGNVILETNNFLGIYKESVKIISDDLNKLNNSIPAEIKHIMTQTGRGRSLIPYFDYYLGMGILSDKSISAETRSGVKKLYMDFYGNKYEPEAHFDGYKDFEK